MRVLQSGRAGEEDSMHLRLSVAVVLAALSVPAVRAQEASPRTLARIAATAEARYPDLAIRKAFEDSQIASYRFLLAYAPDGIPAESLQRVKAGIEARFPDDYWAQQQLVEHEVDSYRAIDTFHPVDMPAADVSEVKARLRKRYGDDYSIQRTLLDAQVESYGIIKAYAPMGIPADAVAAIGDKVSKKYPYDYSTQRTALEREVMAYLDRQKP
jgi:hypothetical protein